MNFCLGLFVCVFPKPKKLVQVPDIIDNAYVIVEFDNGSRGMLDLCMFAEGTKNEQEISVVGNIGKVSLSLT